jgi:hypothetical protein
LGAEEIAGLTRIVAGQQIFDGVSYRLRIVRENRKLRVVDGTIEAVPGVVRAIHDAGDVAIELTGELGWLAFVVLDVVQGAIKLIGRGKSGYVGREVPTAPLQGYGAADKPCQIQLRRSTRQGHPAFRWAVCRGTKIVAISAKVHAT